MFRMILYGELTVTNPTALEIDAGRMGTIAKPDRPKIVMNMFFSAAYLYLS